MCISGTQTLFKMGLQDGATKTGGEEGQRAGKKDR